VEGAREVATKARPDLYVAHSAGTRDMPEMEFVGNLVLLIVGGNDTTRNSMSGGLLALSQNPDQLAKLKANPGLVPSLVAETIRYQTPAIHMRRTATRDTELAGQHIRSAHVPSPASHRLWSSTPIGAPGAEQCEHSHRPA
jgi:cytochrome P450